MGVNRRSFLRMLGLAPLVAPVTYSFLGDILRPRVTTGTPIAVLRFLRVRVIRVDHRLTFRAPGESIFVPRTTFRHVTEGSVDGESWRELSEVAPLQFGQAVRRGPGDIIYEAKSL